MKLVITFFFFLCCLFSITALHAQKAWQNTEEKNQYSTPKSADLIHLSKSSCGENIETDFLNCEEEDEEAERKHTLRIFALISRIYLDGKASSPAIPLLYCHLALNAESCKYIEQRVLRI